MDVAVRLVVTVGLLLAATVVLRVGGALRRTSLATAWLWSLAAVLLWVTGWFATVLSSLIENSLTDQLWYFTAVVSLCPPIAVLGARRPGSNVWTWFVLVPLVLVLGLPAMTAWHGSFRVAPLKIETPPLVGIGLVLVMGAGNYLGTRFTFPSVLFAASAGLLIVPLASAFDVAADNRGDWRIAAAVCMCLAIFSAAWPSRRETRSRLPIDRVWRDFRDWFGIVWARRVQDRVNEAAQNQRLPVRLEHDGVKAIDLQVSEEALLASAGKIESTLRWLLKRFVEPDWIDLRLQACDKEGSRPDAASAPAKSVSDT